MKIVTNMPYSIYHRIHKLEIHTGIEYSLLKIILEDNKDEIINKLISDISTFKIYVCEESREKINKFIEYYALENIFDKVETNTSYFYMNTKKINDILSYEQIENVLSFLYDYIDASVINTILRQLNLI